MSGDHELSRDADVDLGGIFANLWRRKGTILLVSLIATALAYLALTIIKPRYNAEVTILIQNSDAVLTRQNDNPTSNQATSNTDEQGVASQVELLQSKTIARNVIKSLALENNPEFDSIRDQSIGDWLLGALGLSTDNAEVAPLDRLIDAYYDRLKVYQLNRARLIVVEFWAHKPELAAEIANAVADEYSRFQEGLNRGAAPAELSQLEPELDLQREKVLEAEKKVAEYKATTGLVGDKDDSTLAEQDLTELSTELSNVRGQLSQAVAKADSLKRAVQSGALESADSVLQSTNVQRLQTDKSALEAQLAQLNTQLLPRHPTILGLRSQVANVDRKIKAEMNKILKSLEAEVEIAKDREKDLISKRNTLKSIVAREEEQKVQLRALQREAQAESELLNAYLVRFKEAKSRRSRGFLPSDAKIVSRAFAQSQAYFPKPLPILAGTFFGSMLLTSMLLLAAGLLRAAPAVPQRKTQTEAIPVTNSSPPPATGSLTPDRQETNPLPRPADQPPVQVAPPLAPVPDVTDEETKPENGEPQKSNSPGWGFSLPFLRSKKEKQVVQEEKEVKSEEAVKPADPEQAVHGALEELKQIFASQTTSGGPNVALGKSPTVADQTTATIIPVSHPPVRGQPTLAQMKADIIIPMPMMTVAKSLTLLDAARTVVITPEGEEKACGAIALARLLASVGPTIVVDMAGEATTTTSMLGTTGIIGVKDILASEVSFAQAIHVDRVSNAHIIPTGTDKAQLKPDSAAVLPVFLDALQNTYRYVIIDAGDANAASLKRFSTPQMGIVVNAVNVKNPAVQNTLQDLMSDDLATPVLMEITTDAAQAVGIAV